MVCCDCRVNTRREENEAREKQKPECVEPRQKGQREKVIRVEDREKRPEIKYKDRQREVNDRNLVGQKLTKEKKKLHYPIY